MIIDIRLNPGKTKNKEGRVIALEGVLLDVIQAQWEKRKVAEIPGQSPTTICPYVFHHDGTSIRDFRAAWKTATAKVGLSGRLFHDNRRSAINNMVKAEQLSWGVAKDLDLYRHFREYNAAHPYTRNLLTDGYGETSRKCPYHGSDNRFSC